MTGTILQRLAERIRAFGPADLPAQAISLSRTAFIDTIGVTLAGSAEPCVTSLLRTPGIAEAPGPCTLAGTDRTSSALDAAFFNGTASHALDYDDFSQPMGGHQSVPLVAPLLAVAEERRLSGAKLIESYVIGVETEIRLARAVNFHHYDKGWHPTATLGVFGAAAGVGHMIGLSAERLTVALAIAASFASGVKANFGTMVKPLHIGQCARNGLLASLLAEAGYDANPTALEHRQGFFNAFNGPGNYDPKRIFEHWADPLEVCGKAMGLKQFPCCGSTHPAIAAMLALRQQERVRAEDVAKIEIMPHRRRLPHTDNPNPQTPLQAKFSVQYVVARALLDGAVRIADFEGGAHFDPRIQALLGKTSAFPHPDMADDADAQFSAEVRITLQDGRVLAHRVDDMAGRGIDNPMSSEELWEKFNDCAGRALPRQNIMPLFDGLETLEKVADMQDVMRLLAKRSVPGAPGAEPQAPAGKNTLLETSWVP
ncbi:MAG: MmgE/PrpD family protein [Acetobacteraceae bacterium]|nr:MmgE/PrpD family protein [Acetobacteraceae bacterium]